MGFCSKCGHKMDNDKFCTFCGAPTYGTDESDRTINDNCNAVSDNSQTNAISTTASSYQPQCNNQTYPTYNSYPTAQTELEEPLTITGWIGYMFLASFLGLIGQIIILCTAKNQTIKNWVFAAWINAALILAVTFISIALFFGPVISELIDMM